MDSAIRPGGWPADRPADKPVDGPAEKPAEKAAAGAPYGWILSPFLDMFFTCGGLMWCLLAAYLVAVSAFGQGTGDGHQNFLLAMSVLGVGGLAIADMHNCATIVRLYETKEIRDGLWRITKLGPVLIAGALLFGLLPPIMSFLAKIYLLLVAQHFTAQTYGIALIYCFKRGYQMSEFDKSMLKGLLRATMLVAVVRQLSLSEYSKTTIFGVPALDFFILPAYANYFSMFVFACIAIAFFYGVARKAVLEQQFMPAPVVLLLVTTLAIFIAGADLLGQMWLFVPAFFHASQYLVVTTSYNLKRQGLPEGVGTSEIATQLVSRTNVEYWSLLLFISLFLYAALPIFISRFFGLDFQYAFGMVFVIVNLHHFVADHAIWRLRDPKIRQLLIA
jgi:hypothetical protein